MRSSQAIPNPINPSGRFYKICYLPYSRLGATIYLCLAIPFVQMKGCNCHWRAVLVQHGPRALRRNSQGI